MNSEQIHWKSLQWLYKDQEALKFKYKILKDQSLVQSEELSEVVKKYIDILENFAAYNKQKDPSLKNLYQQIEEMLTEPKAKSLSYFSKTEAAVVIMKKKIGFVFSEIKKQEKKLQSFRNDANRHASEFV